LIHEARFTLEKITSRLKLIEPLVYRKRFPLPAFKYKLYPEGNVPLPVDENDASANWTSLSAYQYWGQWNSEFVLINRFALPAEAGSLEGLALYLPLGVSGDFCHPEALAYADGRHFAACDRNHQELPLPSLWQDGQSHLLTLHGWTGLGGMVGSEPTQLFMRPCELVQVDEAAREFTAQVRVATGAVTALAENDPARAQILNALEAAFKLLDTREEAGETFYASLPAAQSALDDGLSAAGSAKAVTIYATGHAHIDVAWLWPLAQTRKKAARTFENALNLMQRYPQFHFSQSQPQLYEFVRRDFPDIFTQIQERVKDGQWEVMGGMWLEADCNLTGAESLARQFLLGRSYFERYFGEEAETPVLWLPDAFGFCYSLPQLIRLAGLKYFFTTKLSWSQTNQMPYDSFWWQGLDGSRVLTHFATTPAVGGEWQAATYNAEVEPGQVMATWNRFKQKELHPNMLMAYGFGDGGGGPTREMVENLTVMSDFPGMPQVRSGSVAEFFDRLEQEDGKRLPAWNGELYLELHRGTYTSQSRNKRANRKAEFALHDAEFLAAAASILNPGFVYPSEELNQDWQLVCLNQFHDILPGSSIGQVYKESLEQYDQVQQSAARIQSEALQQTSAALAGGETAAAGLWAANPTGFEREDLIFWQGALPEGEYFARPDGTPIPAQSAETGTWLAAGNMPAYSLTGLLRVKGTPPAFKLRGLVAAPDCLENDFVRVEFNPAGEICRLLDKTNQREVLPAGETANQFQAFEDRPVNWDAWDLDRSYEEKCWLAEPTAAVRVLESGPLRATLEIKKRVLKSDLVQTISLAYNSPRLDFETHIDWREKHTLLKVAFPVDVMANEATYEIQWGNIQRPTHENTSWDWARFEVCAHKWVDLSEGNYGVSLLNDCKYGHDIHGHVIRLSLLRSPTEPDAHADEGQHTFRYALLPHGGGWDERTVAAAYAFNDPCLFTPLNGRPKQGQFSLVSVDQPNVVIETIKQAEDGNGLIVRLYESQRSRGPVTLRTGFNLASASSTDLLEHDRSNLKNSAREVYFDLLPYQILTLRLVPTANN
jgi:alpha-mannosidase